MRLPIVALVDSWHRDADPDPDPRAHLLMRYGSNIVEHSPTGQEPIASNLQLRQRRTGK